MRHLIFSIICSTVVLVNQHTVFAQTIHAPSDSIDFFIKNEMNDNLSIVVLTNLAGASPDAFMDELAGFYIPDLKETNGFGLSRSVKSLRDELSKTDLAIKNYEQSLKLNLGNDNARTQIQKLKMVK